MNRARAKLYFQYNHCIGANAIIVFVRYTFTIVYAWSDVFPRVALIRVIKNQLKQCQGN